MHKGIDVSKYNNPANFDWDVLKTSIEFMYAKASDGVGSPDPKFAMWVASAKAASIPIGAYHYLRVRHGVPQDAIQQADEFCVIHEALKCDLIPMVDVELVGNSNVTDGELAEALLTFLKRCEERLSVKPLIYTYPAFWMSHRALASMTEFATYPLWIAHYTLGKPIVPAPWTDWLIWQNAAGAGVLGHVDGIKGIVDVDVMNADVDVIKYVRPEPVKETTEEPVADHPTGHCHYEPDDI